MAAWSTSNGITLAVFSPADFHELTRTDLATPAFGAFGGGNTAAFNCGEVPPFAYRQMWNQDFSRMAAVIHRADNTAHVGYVDVGTGQVTDLAGVDAGAFGSPAARAEHALFDDATGELWYVIGDGHVHSTNLNSRTDTDHGQTGATGSMEWWLAGSTNWVLSTEIVFGVGTTKPMPNPSGTVAVTANGTSLLQADEPSGFLVWRANTPTTSASAASISSNRTETTYTPVQWLDDHRLLSSVLDDRLESPGFNRSNYAIVTFSDDYQTATTGANLLPDSDYRFESAVASPDGATLVFEVNNGGLRTVYRQSLTDGGQPEKVRDLSRNAPLPTFLAWR